MAQQPRYTLGEQVTIRGMREGVRLLGVVISVYPLKARVTNPKDPDPVFEGAETTDGIRKINPKTGLAGKKRK